MNGKILFMLKDLLNQFALNNKTSFRVLLVIGLIYYINSLKGLV